MLFNILNKFKRIWQSEYLLSLTERHYGAISTTNISNIRVCGVVVVECDSPRGEWSLGRIEELIPDTNGLVPGLIAET